MMEKAEPTLIYDSSKRGSTALEELNAIFEYRNLVFQLVRRDILTRYKRSVLGVAWTMLNPLMTSLILAVVFYNAFGGTKSYPAYVLSGIIAWNFFAQTTLAAISHLVWGGGLLKKIYVPRTIFAVTATGTGLVNLGLSLIPLILIVWALGIPPSLNLLLLPIPVLFLAMFALGIGLLVSNLAIFYTDVAEMYQIVLTAWFYLSPVIFTDELLPPELLFWIKLLNPMYHLINLFRATIYEIRTPTLNEFLITGGIALITLIIGWLVFTRNSDEYAYRV
ncbi:ABC transporter permease [Chloroflexota bacterium]